MSTPPEPPASASGGDGPASGPAGGEGATGDDRPIVLSINQLTKDFGKLRAVDHLDLTVRKGDVFGFLGPNGAGKTTTIRMVLGLIFPTSGHVQVLEHRVPGARVQALRHLGGFVEVPAFYTNMTARQNLRLIGSAGGRVSEQRITEVLEVVGLMSRGESKVGSYSHGMKQRLGIANALLNRPELVILDEPTSGLDPQGMKDVRELVLELGKRGTTVFLSSHLLHEIEQVCNRAVIINKGRKVVEGPVSTLRPRQEAIKVLTADQPRAADTARALFGDQSVSWDEEYLVVRTADAAVPELIAHMVAAGIAVHTVMPAGEQGLEDYFLELTQSSDVDPDRRQPAASG